MTAVRRARGAPRSDGIHGSAALRWWSAMGQALRERQHRSLLAQLAPVLDPGEVPLRAVRGQTGVHPRCALSPLFLLLLWTNRSRVVLVTDRSVLLVVPPVPCRRPVLLERLSRRTRLSSACTAPYSRVRIGMHELWLDRRSCAHLAAADAAADTGAPLDCSDDPQPSGALAASLLATVGLLLFVLGVQDLASDPGSLRVAALSWAAVGATMVAAAVGLSRGDRSPWAVVTAWGGATAGLGVAAYCLLEYQRYQHLPALLLASAVLLPSAAALRVVPRSSSASGSRVAAQIVGAVGLGAGLLWNGFTWYADAQRAAAGGPLLNISSSLVPGPQRSGPGLQPFEGTVKVRNASPSRVQIVTSLYRVTGLRVAPRRVTDAEFFGAAVLESQDGQAYGAEPPSVSRFAAETMSDVLEFGRVLPSEDYYFEPGEQHTLRFLLLVPTDARSRPHGLRLSVELMSAAGDLRMGDPGQAAPVRLVTQPDPEVWEQQYTVGIRPLEERSVMRGLLRGRHTITILRRLQYRPDMPGPVPETPALDGCVAMTDARRTELLGNPLRLCPYGDDRSARLQRLYEVVFASQSHEVTVPSSPPRGP